MKTRHLVEPEALSLIEQFPQFHFSTSTLPEIRAVGRKMALASKKAPPSNVSMRHAVAPGLEGGPDVALVVYTPTGPAMRRGAVFFIHAGGYILGDAESEAPWCEWLVAELGCVVVSPNYRLAPETSHPGPVLDCYAGLKWLYQRADDFAVDKKRVAVMGGSAGGGLAAAVALLARDRREISLRFQCLWCPMLDDRTAVEADPNPFAGEYVWTRDYNRFGWTSLLGHEPGLPDVSPYASAARATDLSGLPPTLIWVGTLDLFVDENIEYARRLIRAGVPVELRVYPGVTHGNLMVPDAPSTQLTRADSLRALKRALWT